MLTREQFDRKFENLQNCQRFYPDSVAKHRYAQYLKAEAMLLVKESYENLHKHYAITDLLDRYWLLIEHSDKLSQAQFDEFWQALQKQEKRLCQPGQHF